VRPLGKIYKEKSLEVLWKFSGRTWKIKVWKTRRIQRRKSWKVPEKGRLSRRTGRKRFWWVSEKI